jgi:transketolase
VQTLALQGLRCAVLSVPTIKPIDDAAICRHARTTGGMVVVEEHTLHGGLGSAVAEVLMDSGVAPDLFLRIGLPSCFTSIVGSQQYLRKRYGIDSESIVSRILEAVRSRDLRRLSSTLNLSTLEAVECSTTV